MYAPQQTHKNEMSSAQSRTPNLSPKMKSNLSLRPPVPIFCDVRVTYNTAPQERQPLQLISDEEAKDILINHLLTYLNLFPRMGDQGNIIFTAIHNCVIPDRQTAALQVLKESGVQDALKTLPLPELTEIKKFILSQENDPQKTYGYFNFTLNSSFSKNFTAHHFAPNPAAAYALSQGRFADTSYPISVSTVLLSSQRKDFYMNESSVLTKAKETQQPVHTTHSYYYWEFKKGDSDSSGATPPIYYSPIILKVKPNGQIYHLQGTSQDDRIILTKEQTPIPDVILKHMSNLYTLIHRIESYVEYDILAGIGEQISTMNGYFSQFFSRHDIPWDENKLADTYGLLIHRFLSVLTDLIAGKDPTEAIMTKFALLNEMLSALSSVISNPGLVNYFALLNLQAFWKKNTDICQNLLSQLTPKTDIPDPSATGLSLGEIINKYAYIKTPYDLGEQIVLGDCEKECERKRTKTELTDIANAIFTIKHPDIPLEDYINQLLERYEETYNMCFPQSDTP